MIIVLPLFPATRRSCLVAVLARAAMRHPIPLTLLAIVPLAVFALPAAGLVFDPNDLVYLEDFDGESSYPTSPEIDALGMGGLVVRGAPDPDLTGGTARANPGPTPPAAGVETETSTLRDDFLAVRGAFRSFLLRSEEAMYGVVGHSYSTPSEPDNSVYALVVVNATFPDSSGALQIHQEHEGGGGVIASVALTEPQAATISNGGYFSLDLAADFANGIVSASVDLGPEGESSLLSIPTLGPLGDFEITRSWQMVGVGGAAPSGDVAGRIEQLEVYRLFTTSFVVDTTADAVDATPGDGACLTAASECSLRAAIQESNTVPGPGEISVPAGTYPLTLVGAGESAAATGDLDITDPLVLTGTGSGVTIVDGNDSDRVFQVHASAGSIGAELRHLTIRSGAAVTAAGALGGGVDNLGQLTLSHCVVADNRANLGGGIMNRGTLVLDGCVVSGNRAEDLGFTNARAGGLASPSTSAGGSDVHATIRNSAIVENEAPAFGGIELGNCTEATIENSTISGNEGTQLRVYDCSLYLGYVTIVSEAKGLDVATSGGATLHFHDTAIEGAPACTFGGIGASTTGYNASNDTSCFFSYAGAIEDTELGLAPLATVGSSRAHRLEPGSPLRDAGEPPSPECLPFDQVGNPRPQESDGVGSPACDIGAIEAPEPAMAWMLASGALAVAALRRRRARRA